MSGHLYTQEEDLLLGARGEEECRSRISAFLGRNISLQGGYAVLDIDGEVCGDIKTRRCRFNDYPSFMFGVNKIQAFRNSGKRCFIFYNLMDGLYYAEYDEEVFQNFAPGLFQRIRANQVDNPSAVIYIPKIWNNQPILLPLP
jgi:hypothetical protein